MGAGSSAPVAVVTKDSKALHRPIKNVGICLVYRLFHAGCGEKKAASMAEKETMLLLLLIVMVVVSAVSAVYLFFRAHRMANP